MEGSTKTKIAVAVTAVIVGVPLWFFSDSSMAARVDEAWEKAGGRPSNPDRTSKVKDPLMAERLYKYIWTYRFTYRVDEMAVVALDWIRRYGGDDREWPEGRMINWEAPLWDDDKNPRPDYYSKEPHPLTPKVLCMIADHYEKHRLYTQSDPIWVLITKKFANGDPDALKEATTAVARAKIRTF